MHRYLLRLLTTSVYPLIGLAILMALAGCAAVPAISLANSLLKPPPAQPVQSVQSDDTPAAQSDIVASLAQRFGITLPAQHAAGPAQAQAVAATPASTAGAQTAAAE